jgi:hypothetical protein
LDSFSCVGDNNAREAIDRFEPTNILQKSSSERMTAAWGKVTEATNLSS